MSNELTDEEHSKVLQLCRKYLEGAWRNDSSNINITRLSGGMTNLIYRCSLHRDTTLVEGEPRNVLLRIYGPSHCDSETELIVFNQLSTKRLGPTLYRAFDEGRFEEYLPSNPLAWSDMIDDNVSAVVAKKIASIQKLNVESLEKNSNWLIDNYYEFNEFIDSVRNKHISFCESILESTKTIANELMTINFKPEIDYLTSLFRRSSAPLVFSHNDLNQNNILLLDDGKRLDDRVVLIDFEYCSYNYRPFDIANHLSEWCFDYSVNEYPNFSASVDRFPSKERQRQFLKNYIDEIYSDTSNPIDDKTKEDDLEVIFHEMQPFFMASNLLWTLWAVKSAYTSKINFGYWEMAKYKWEIYLFCKQNYDNGTRNNNKIFIKSRM